MLNFAQIDVLANVPPALVELWKLEGKVSNDELVAALAAASAAPDSPLKGHYVVEIAGKAFVMSPAYPLIPGCYHEPHHGNEFRQPVEAVS